MSDEIASLIIAERGRQDIKHGEFNATLAPFTAELVSNIVEELGEYAQCVNDRRSAKTIEEKDQLERYCISELVQVAALCVQELERIQKSNPALFQ